MLYEHICAFCASTQYKCLYLSGECTTYITRLHITLLCVIRNRQMAKACTPRGSIQLRICNISRCSGPRTRVICIIMWQWERMTNERPNYSAKSWKTLRAPMFWGSLHKQYINQSISPSLSLVRRDLKLRTPTSLYNITLAITTKYATLYRRQLTLHYS